MTALLLGLALAATAGPVRADSLVPSDPGIRLFVREVRPEKATGVPVLLLHGARVPGLASFDLAVAGGSLAADLAAAGHPVYVMDARGYGGSTRPAAMDEPPSAHPPLVRSPEVVRDIGAIVEWICGRAGVERVALFGWATGGHWAGFFATLHPERVSHLVMFNTLYGATSGHPMLGPGSDLENPARPGRFDPAFGAYRLGTEASLFGAWDRSIPVEDKASWRDPAVAKAYGEAALASDPTSSARTPATFRSPAGAMEDSFLLASGHRLWDASLIHAPTLVIASELDFWSRPGDREALRDELVHASSVRVVVLPQATHLAHLDRPEHGRTRLIQEVVGFLNGGAR